MLEAGKELHAKICRHGLEGRTYIASSLWVFTASALALTILRVTGKEEARGDLELAHGERHGELFERMLDEGLPVREQKRSSAFSRRCSCALSGPGIPSWLLFLQEQNLEERVKVSRMKILRGLIDRGLSPGRRCRGPHRGKKTCHTKRRDPQRKRPNTRSRAGNPQGDQCQAGSRILSRDCIMLDQSIAGNNPRNCHCPQYGEGLKRGTIAALREVAAYLLDHPGALAGKNERSETYLDFLQRLQLGSTGSRLLPVARLPARRIATALAPSWLCEIFAQERLACLAMARTPKSSPFCAISRQMPGPGARVIMSCFAMLSSLAVLDMLRRGETLWKNARVINPRHGTPKSSMHLAILDRLEEKRGETL
ncbi:hypothetical protein SELMODRAFT_420336 [Selaginella moellendorffii]|uniref:Uncharacterized protein n=1 Tax=Selaginella moellendorffii TaxID=88036 RepID=D8SBN9_SELML|nr:hypothetical protein SELMODRAFT_420336 [Selaginella moellendorffii]